MRRTARWSLVLAVLAWASPGAAQSRLTVRTLAHGDWGDAVAGLQTDLGSEGRAVRVVVEDARGHRAPCGAYQIMLDSHGSRAFDVEGCDPETMATRLRLVDRAALFDTGDVVARPRPIGIAAVEHRHGSALGGARLAAETELRCSVAVRPYLRDMLTGERVLAAPDRFAMRPVGDGVRIEAEGDAWRVRAGSMRVSYELVDRRTGDVVLRETVRLSCGNGGAPDAETASGRDVIRLRTDRVYRGATLTRTRHDDHGSCGGHEGPEQWYVVRLDEPARLNLRLVSEFDATLYVREGSIGGSEIACRDRAARLETLDINLEAGVYYVAVDGSGTHGRYRLVSFEDAVDPRALPVAPRRAERDTRSVLVPAASRRHGSCGGDQAPEHVYALRVDRPSFVSVRLTSRFDSALYLVRPGGAEVACRRTLGWPRTRRRSHVRAELEPGTYYVVVDGESGYAGTGRYRLAVDRLPLP
ncbi:MAG TPA: hypothetical protein RMH99_27925 [Sandaracinaceae bacterium LLY-WYZ-13_1]|nr:hypothetical protein [Sandaracinaceae bacterium LLY-WYZ-13_1]